jgi:HlyD family secretion protein
MTTPGVEGRVTEAGRHSDWESHHPSHGDAGHGRPAGGGWGTIVLLLVAAVLAAGAYWWWSDRQRRNDERNQSGGTTSRPADSASKAALGVFYVNPRKGGLAQTTTQPGTVHAFQYADLYAKASGYLRGQIVDIGDTVEKGQVLAEVYDPERQQRVELAAAEVERAKAAVSQAQAREQAAEAGVSIAQAAVAVRETEVSQTAAVRRFREKEYIRYVELARRQAVDQRVADERQEEFEGAKSAEERAAASVKAAEADIVRAVAQVATAKADIQHARAQQHVAEATLREAEILAQYTRIISPYTGVVLERNFHDGDFIREATRGDERAVLTVARTDLMRVIIYVPDRDTPALDRGDEAVVRIDALPGEEFKGKVARFSEYELAANRTMRAEVDLPNPARRLHMGMYGMVTILLEPASNHLTIPSKCLREVDAGAGTVYVVEKDRARKRSVRTGRDDGIRAEVIGGLSANDRVIVQYTGSIEDGEPVDAQPLAEPEGQANAPASSE